MVGLPGDLFRRGVGWRAPEIPLEIQVYGGQAKIDQVRGAVADHDVFRFDVVQADAAGMYQRQAARELRETDLKFLPFYEGTGRKRFPRNEFRNDGVFSRHQIDRVDDVLSLGRLQKQIFAAGFGGKFLPEALDHVSLSVCGLDQ